MLHGIKNEQGHCLYVRDDIADKNKYFSHVSYKSPASGALILGIIIIADNKPMDL